MESKKDMSVAHSIIVEPIVQREFGDDIYKCVEKFICAVGDSWEDFCIDSLYREWQKLGITKAFIISREDFKKFVKWALPEYEKRFINDK